MPARNDSVSDGDSTVSQSCLEIFSGLRLFIVFPLAAVCPSQADQANCFFPACVDKHMETIVNKTKGNHRFSP
jgi:hypothetical protein